MKIGLVGEAPLDTMSIKTILGKKYSNLEFVELLKNIITGSILENQTTKTKLRLECSIHRPDIVIFIRDLDGLLTKKYRKQRLLRQKYYREFKGCTHTKKTIYLLNIWEIEALILSDINCFNQYYIKPIGGGKIKTQQYVKIEKLFNYKLDTSNIECRRNPLKKKW